MKIARIQNQENNVNQNSPIKLSNDNKKNIMTRKNEGKSTPTILSRDLKIEGDLLSKGLVEIEGHVHGSIRGNSVIIREDGIVEGEIMAETLNIKGRFKGSIKSKNVSISSKANVNGEIAYSTLCVEDGACIDGQFKRMEEGRSEENK